MNKRQTACLLPLRGIVFPCAFLGLALVTGRSLTDLSKWWPVVAVVVNLGCMALLLTLSKGQYARFVNYEKGKTRFGFAAAAAAVTLLVGFAGMYGAGFVVYGSFPYLDKVMAQPLPIPVAVICALLLPITTTLAEDGIYLGAIHNADGDLAVTLASAFFYGAQHSFIPLLPDGRFILYRFLCFAPLTPIFCLWYRKTRNPLPFMIGHFVINLATASTLMAAACFPEFFV